ncbi:MAG: alpha/beta fold hydrolase [Burkholderiaceae bacterium]
MRFTRFLLVAAVFAISQTSHAETPQIKTVQVNGTDLEYVEEGSGTPVVFVHGAISDLRLWEGFRKKVGMKHRFISYTRRYFGKQPWQDNGEKFTREFQARDLVAFIEAVSKEPVHLFTWSSGGNVGTHANVMRPDLIRSAVHFEPVTFSLTPEIPGMTAAQSQQFEALPEVFKLMKQKRVGDAAQRFLEVVWDLPKGGAESAVSPAVIKMLRDNGHTISLSMNAPPYSKTTCEVLARIKTPTLVMVGSESKPFFPMLAERQAQCQSNAIVASVKGVNHNGPLAALETVLKRAMAFYAMFD